MKSLPSQISRIEALIYSAGDSGVSIDQLSSILGITAPQVITGIQRLKRRYDDSDCAFTLLNVGHHYQMITKRAFNPDVQKLLKNSQEKMLTSAALETLTIIAYNQPVTRIEVDDVRGVNSSMTIQKLLRQRLITKKGRKKVPGNPIMYVTTRYFLNLFGIKSLKDLPALPNNKKQEGK